ncbi:MAG: secretin N-terminal domain-containing protein [Candidatus Babeliales bacterium]
MNKIGFLRIFTLIVCCAGITTTHAQYKKKKTTSVVNEPIAPAESAATEKGALRDVILVGDNGQQQLDEQDRTKRLQDITCVPEGPACPAAALQDGDDLIEINLENSDLQNIIAWISAQYHVSFVSEETLQPLPAGSKTITGNSIIFHSHKSLSKKEMWDLFITFLDLYGLTLVATAHADIYKIKITEPNKAQSANKTALPSYINVHWKNLPQDDMRIRYIYFVKNSTLAALQGIVDAFRSNTATLQPLEKLNAFIMTDKSSNIRALMQIVDDLDQITSPEVLSVLRLRNTDAEVVKNLYEELTKQEDPQKLAARILGAKKAPTAVYFPASVRLIAEPRTNTLIILGDKDGIKKVEDFILKYVDVELEIPYSPVYVYELQYVSADAMAQLLNEVTKFAPNSPAAQSGGVRQGDKYLQPMTFQPEPSGNRLLIRAEKEDYLKVREIIKQLDVKQPQIAIEVLVVDVNSTDSRELGVQIRNKDFNTISKNLNFQNSGLPNASGTSQPVIDPNTGSIVSNLISLAANQDPGSTLLTITSATGGVWGIFKALQTVVHTNVIANPFLITTNKYQAQVSIGQTRRVLTAQVVGVATANALGDVSASLTVKITPQINALGIINLDIAINIDTFTDATNPNDANKNVKTIRTNTSVGNKEILAIGGLLQTTQNDSTTEVPLLGSIPVIGWFFKNKTKSIIKDNLLVFIAPRIVEPLLEGGLTQHTQVKADNAKIDFREMTEPATRRDPIHRWFFRDKMDENADTVDIFVQQKHKMVNIDVPPLLMCNQKCEFGDSIHNPVTPEEIRAKQCPDLSITTTGQKPTTPHKAKELDGCEHPCEALISANDSKKYRSGSLVSVFPDAQGVGA